jgi:hypothetical protein
MSEHSIGQDRRLVSYYSEDDGGEADLETFVASVAVELGAEAAAGWNALSTSFLPTRHVRSGMLDTGGQRTSMYAAVVLFARD